MPPLVGLKRSDISRVPTEYAFREGEAQCGADGRVYAYYRLPGQAGFHAVRFGLDLQPEQVFSVPPEVQQYYDTDEFAPTSSGGIVLVGSASPAYSPAPELLLRFDEKGHFTDAVPIKPVLREFQPERLALFPDGTLLAVDVRNVGYGSEPGRHWLAAIVNQDGAIAKKFSLDTSSLLSASIAGNSQNSAGNPDIVLDVVGKRQLQLYPSSNGNVYAAFPARGCCLNLKSGVAEISPAGEVTYYAFPTKNGQALLKLAVSANKVLAVFGSDYRNGTEVDSFLINHSKQRLELVGRYRMLPGAEDIEAAARDAQMCGERCGKVDETSMTGGELLCAIDNGLFALHHGAEWALELALYRIP